MTPKQIVEAFIVVSAWSVYLFLVIVKIANIEGFVALTVYIVKKFLDMLEVNHDVPVKKSDMVVRDISGGKPVNI